MEVNVFFQRYARKGCSYVGNARHNLIKMLHPFVGFPLPPLMGVGAEKSIYRTRTLWYFWKKNPFFYVSSPPCEQRYFLQNFINERIHWETSKTIFQGLWAVYGTSDLAVYHETRTQGHFIIIDGLIWYWKK